MVEHFSMYEGPVSLHFRQKSRIYDLFITVLSSVSRVLSGDKIDLAQTDYAIILRKPLGWPASASVDKE